MSLHHPTPEAFAVEARINGAIGVAISHGFAIPPEYARARALASAADKLALNARAAPTPPPTEIADLAAWVAAEAAEAAMAPYKIAAAERASDAATRTALRAAVDMIPTWLGEICAAFPAAVDSFNRLRAISPRAITARSTSDEFKLHTELLAAVETLTGLALARGQFALAGGEDEQLGHEGVWLVLEPGPDASLQAVAEVVRTIGAGVPTTLEQWEAVAEIGVGVARGGDVGRRIERFAALRHASGMSPHGGMRDETYASASALLGQPSTVAAVSY